VLAKELESKHGIKVEVVRSDLAVAGAATKLFEQATAGGPVSHYTIKVPVAMADKVAVSPSHGSLAANKHVAVTVTVTSTVALNSHVTVNPGNLTIKVVLKIKA